MQTFRERIAINGEIISEEELVLVFEEVKKASDKLKEKNMNVTYFEFATAMAFLYFEKKKCDFAVVEVGMGGRLDATNIVKPDVCVITNIALEHMQYLGDTKEKIALEKAGIIKKSVVVIGEKDEKIRDILLKIAKDRGSRAIIVEKDYEGKIYLQGKHQKRNAAMAIAAAEELGIGKEEIEKGLVDVREYRIIYDAVNDMKNALEGLLEAKIEKHFLGRVEIREVFRLSKQGVVAGCYVQKGKVHRKAHADIVRDGDVIFSGVIGTLKRFKDDVRDVTEGMECGIKLDGFDKYQKEDVIEVYEIESIAQKL